MICLGVGSLFVSLVVNLPARLIVDQLPKTGGIVAVTGTLWQGRVVLAGEQALGWRLAPWRSLTGLGLAADITAQGPGSDAAGPVLIRPGGIAAGPVDGTLSAALIGALLPEAGVACDGGLVARGLRVDVSRRAASGAGELRSGPIACRGGLTLDLPAARLVLTEVGGGLQVRATTTEGDEPLFRADVDTDGGLTATLHARAAALIPGMPSSADSTVQMPLSALFP